MPFLYKFKRIIISLLPPVLFDIFLLFLYKLKGKPIKSYVSQELKPRIPSKEDFSYSNGNKVYFIPVDKVFHYGGQRFNSVDQPFYRFLKYGKKSFQEYYENHQPTSIFDAHNLKIENTEINSYNSKNFDYRLPWLDQPHGNLALIISMVTQHLDQFQIKNLTSKLID